MPRIPVYQAQASPGVVESARFPRADFSAQTQAFADVEQLGARLGKIAQKLQREREDVELATRAAEYDAHLKEIHLNLQHNAEVIKNPATIGEWFTVQERDTRKRILSGIKSPTVRAAFEAYAARTVPKASVEVMATGLKLGIQQSVADLDDLEESASRTAAEALTPEERDEQILRFTTRVNRAAENGVIDAVEKGKRRRSFDGKTRAKHMDVVRRTNPDLFWEMYERGDFADVDPVKADIIFRAAKADQERAERSDKDADEAVKAAREDRKLEIGAMIAAGDVEGAQSLLNFHADLRTLDAATVRQFREDIAKGPTTRASDPSVLSFVALDAEGMNPRTTEQDVDRLHERYTRGLPGLNLADAVRIKSQIRQTRTALRKEGESDLVREHNQAEQELRAAAGIEGGIAMMVAEQLGQSPRTRIYRAALSELRQRSRLFGGQESPLKIVDEMVPRVIRALGTDAALQEKEIRGLLIYPTPEALEKAKAAGAIGGAAYLAQRRLFLQLPKPEEQPPKPAQPRARQ